MECFHPFTKDINSNNRKNCDVSEDHLWQQTRRLAGHNHSSEKIGAQDITDKVTRNTSHSVASFLRYLCVKSDLFFVIFCVIIIFSKVAK